MLNLKITAFMNNLRNSLVLICLIICQASHAQSKWIAPADANNLKNPLAGNTAVLPEAKKTYSTMCVPCHGDKGKGNGPAAVALNPRPADHTSAVVQSQSDGALYWKLTNGRGAMQAYKLLLTDQQRWALINYIRTLKK
jgi:mono/diheme cytochrome c family protein